MIFPIYLLFLLATLSTLTYFASSSPLILLPTANISASASNLQCIDSPDWATSRFLAGDCYTAIDKFHNREVERYNSMVLEFLAANITPSFPSTFFQFTPRKYKYKSCTMAIVMLKDLPGGAAPGTSFPKTDLCTYVFVENAAKNVLQGCLSPVLGKGEGRGGSLGFVNPTGYDIAGTYEAIGVFLWDTDSAINQEIQVAEVSLLA